MVHLYVPLTCCDSLIHPLGQNRGTYGGERVGEGKDGKILWTRESVYRMCLSTGYLSISNCGQTRVVHRNMRQLHPEGKLSEGKW